jgi:DNA-binding MurR/RpiR family transcriptional regulator
MQSLNPLQKIIKKKIDSFSPNDKKIGNFMLHHQVTAALETVETLAKKIEVSKSAIVRFAMRLGYRNFKTLQRELQSYIYYQKMESPLDLLSKVRNLGEYRGKDILNEQFKKNIENIKTTSESISGEEFNKMVHNLCNGRGRIFIVGQRKSYGLAFYFYALINPMLEGVYLLENRDSLLTDDLLSVEKKDILVAFSFKRYSIVTVNVIEYFGTVGAKVVLITDSYVSPASKWANYTFTCASGGISIFDTAVSAISLIEAIVSSVAALKEKAVKGRLRTSENLLKKFKILEK